MASRRNRIKIWMLILLLFALIGVGGTGALMRPRMAPDQVLEARFGDVIWNHELHARMQEIANCQVCHHKESQGVIQPRPCDSCHKPLSNRQAVVLADMFGTAEDKSVSDLSQNQPEASPPMTAYHAKCIDCHRAMRRGPVICRDCHAQSFHGSGGVVRWDHRAHARKIDMGAGPHLKDRCVRCHHQDGKAVTEADYRSCRACHQPARELGLDMATGFVFHQDLKHTDCMSCHVITNPAEGLRMCKDCHARLEINPEVMRPSIEQALHAACLVCHNAENPKLKEGAPSRCDDCHRPDPSVIADLGFGILMWDHDRHGRYGEGMQCDVCHHTDDPESPHLACRSCHGSGMYENPSLVDALRKLCIECHQERQNGLVSWSHLVQDWDLAKLFKVEALEGKFFWNHREHAISWSFSCRNCHHPLLRKGNQSFTASELDRRWSREAVHPGSCRICHGGDGAVKNSPAQGTGAPTFVDALKKVCLECHKSLGGGPQTWDDFFEEIPR